MTLKAINQTIKIKYSIRLMVLVFLAACSSSDNEPLEEIEATPPKPAEPEVFESDLGTTTIYDRSKMSDSFILVNDPGNGAVYLMDKEGAKITDWELESGLGNDVFLLPNSKLLASLDAEEVHINIGGSGGKLQLIDALSNRVEWNFDYSSEDFVTHHDAEILPNGNVLAMVWERKTAVAAQEAGSVLDIDVFPEGLIEIDPTTNEIVWAWYAWDHLVQDHDETKENFGSVAQHPQLIDLNYIPQTEGDIMHANGIAYDPSKDVIFISVNFFNEVWVIDHSTTTQEAASHSGGTHEKGGDLIYRFGNPDAYDNPKGSKRFDRNHFPNLLTGAASGNILVYSNGKTEKQSVVYELKLPDNFTLSPDTDNEPLEVWSYTHPELYSEKFSGAVRLPNGNTLITEGDFGIWEVTESG
jgi:hypothetical protein